MDLYISRGFDRTTTADIAQAVGLTERTFFRHFTDKREVLLGGQELLERAFLDGVAAAAPDASPLEIVESALSAVATFFPAERRDHSGRRQRIISGEPGAAGTGAAEVGPAGHGGRRRPPVAWCSGGDGHARRGIGRDRVRRRLRHVDRRRRGAVVPRPRTRGTGKARGTGRDATRRDRRSDGSTG
ncbi:TetR family transcriptional regulator [Streptomyces sp. NPDC056730]